VVVTGCSGGGKSTLLAELARRGHRVHEQPGRAIVREQLACGGDALPWANGARFAALCIERALMHYESALRQAGQALFDRSFIDNCCGLERSGRALTSAQRRALRHCRYARRVFVLPPWPALFATDAERRHGFAAALEEYESLLPYYERCGYALQPVPPAPVGVRADMLERMLPR
jgi:predicted ATPase